MSLMQSPLRKWPHFLKMSALALVALVGTLILPSCDDKEDPTAGEMSTKVLVVTAIPDEKHSDQEANYEELRRYLADQLGIKVEFSISASYDAAVERFKNGEVHLVWFGGFTGVQARKAVPGARAIAQGDVDPKYKSYFIAHKSTGLTKSDDFPVAIKDLSFTFGSKSSTSGRLMPTYFILKQTGVMPDQFFTQPTQFQTVGGHDATARAVAGGSVDAGVLSYKKYDSMVASGEIRAEDAPIIWETPEYADYNLTVHPALEEMFGEGFIDQLQRVLVECEDEKVLKAFLRKRLIPASNEEFDGIHEVARELGMMR